MATTDRNDRDDRLDGLPPLGAQLEADAPASPHDKIFKVVFGVPEHAAVVLREALPATLVGALDWDRLVPGPTVVQGSDLREGTRDLLFKTVLRPVADDGPAPEVAVDLLFEHASRPRRRLRLRLNGYLQRGWESAQRSPHDPGSPPPLPVILPVVLHQGPGTWTIPQLVELFELPPTLTAVVAPFTPTFDVALFDLGDRSDGELDELPAGVARFALVALKAARDGDGDLVRRLASRSEDIQAARMAGSSGTVAEVFSYTAWVSGRVPDERFFDEVRRELAPVDQEAVMPEFMLLSERIEAKGAEARLDEARLLLSRLLRRKFPTVPVTEYTERLQGAKLEQLEGWAEQLVVATTVDEVFAV